MITNGNTHDNNQKSSFEFHKEHVYSFHHKRELVKETESSDYRDNLLVHNI